MRPHRLTAVLLASVLLLAGCAGAGDGGKETTAPADAPETAAPDSAPLLTAGVTDYALVYDLDGSGARSLAMAVAEVLERETGVRLSVRSDAERYPHEILIGSPDRDAVKTAKNRLGGSDAWGICTVGSTVVLCGRDNASLVRAVRRFAKLLGDAAKGNLTLTQDITASDAPEEAAGDRAACVTLYRELFGTYGSYVDAVRASLSPSDAADQAEIEALIGRMQGCIGFRVGSNCALRDGFFTVLDPADYSRTAELRGDALWVPAAFVPGAAASEGFVNLTAYAGQSGGRVVTDATRQAAVWVPSGAAGDCTDAASLAKLLAVYDDPARREPRNPTEGTRQVITESLYDPTFVYDYTKNAYRTNYSPGICVTREKGREVIYVSYENCLVTNFATESGNVTHLLVSHDGGKTFDELGTVNGMRWGCLFEVQGVIYLLGTHVEGSDALIARYDPQTGKFFSKNLGFRGGIGAPCPVLTANGRIYKASGDRVMSASLDADLTVGASWVMSEQSARDILPESRFLALSGAGHCESYALGEASITLGPDGAVYMLLRVDSNPVCGYAAIVRVSADGRTLEEVEECGSLIRFPSTVSKFSIVRDAGTGLYLSMTSLPTRGNAKQRNVLALVASADLIHWSVVDTLLVDREVMNARMSEASHAFQYVDFAVSGDCLRLVVRETTGPSNTYHDGKYITLYTVNDYPALLRRAGLTKKGQLS